MDRGTPSDWYWQNAEKQAELFVDGARKAGLPACVPADKLKDMDAPNLTRVKLPRSATRQDCE